MSELAPADVGGMEFYASAVVSADPFALAEEMKKQSA